MTGLAINRRPSRTRARQALACIDAKYPGGLSWLERKLDAAGRGGCEILALEYDGQPVAWAVISPKGRFRRKLSTFLVEDYARHCGIGHTFLEKLKSRWHQTHVDRVHVTVDVLDLDTQRFFLSAGFSAPACPRIRYGGEREDLLLIWDAGRDQRPSPGETLKSQSSARRRLISAAAKAPTLFSSQSGCQIMS